MWVRVLVKRVGFLLLVVWVASTINFILPRMTGQNPIRERIANRVAGGLGSGGGVEEMIEIYDRKFGLDKPLWRQYLTYMGDLARGDLGQSIPYYPREVKTIIGDSLPWTLGLVGFSTAMAFIWGSLYGAVVDWEGAPRWLVALAPVLFTFSAIPFYLMGLILLHFLSHRLRWFPGYGGYTIGVIPNLSWDFVVDVLKHSALPALSIVLVGLGFWALGMRGLMVSVKGEDYMTMGDAKGLKRRRLFLRYGIGNALLPQVTSLALALGYVMSGSILVEIVFGYPGLGHTLFRAVREVDYPVIQGIVLAIILSLAFTTLLVDLALPILDPRIRRS
jgi:peptide/nickel transport system permease protein